MKAYNGHRSWNAWNVALWIGDDEGLYQFAMECIESVRRRYPIVSNSSIACLAACHFLNACNDRTPDGAVYNHLCIKLAMEGFME